MSSGELESEATERAQDELPVAEQMNSEGCSCRCAKRRDRRSADGASTAMAWTPTLHLTQTLTIHWAWSMYIGPAISSAWPSYNTWS
eukprot:745702-Hanusia_phi.AAC.5